MQSTARGFNPLMPDQRGPHTVTMPTGRVYSYDENEHSSASTATHHGNTGDYRPSEVIEGYWDGTVEYWARRAGFINAKKAAKALGVKGPVQVLLGCRELVADAEAASVTELPTPANAAKAAA